MPPPGQDRRGDGPAVAGRQRQPLSRPRGAGGCRATPPTGAHVLVRDSRRPAGGDAGVFRPARLRRRLRRKTRILALAPNSTARHRPPSDTTARWAARSRVALASAPLAGDDGAPGRGRLCPASGSVDHWPCSRPPWLSTTGGGEGGAMPGGRGRLQGWLSRGGGEALRCAPTPASSLRCGDSCGGGVGVTSETMDDKQTTIKS